MRDMYEAPALVEHGTVEEWTRQEPPIDIELSVVIG